MEKRPQRPPRPPYRDRVGRGLFRLVEAPEQGGRHMAMFGMKVVARPIKVRRHGGNEVTTVLLAIGLTEHDATDLRNRIPLICRFERAGQERLFAHRLRRFRSEEHTSELQSLMRISYACFCLKKKKQTGH